jgi:hypothetical protein
MKTPIGLLVALTAFLTGSAAAQEDGLPPDEHRGPLGSPVQNPNINQYANPTAPAILPPNHLSDPMAPTYPAGSDKPAFPGGTIGDKPGSRADMPDTAGDRKKQVQKERALPEPGLETTHTGAPLGEEASPTHLPEGEEAAPGAGSTPGADVPPGAVQGGPQPY